MIMRTLTSSHRQRITLIRSYACLLQEHLGGCLQVVPCELYSAGQHLADFPCSIVTQQEGKLRLVLNVHAPLIWEAAKKAASSKTLPMALELGATMLWTSSWPMRIGFKCNKGLICGPHENFCGPIPHQELPNISNAGEVCRIAIWPRRIHGIGFPTNKDVLGNGVPSKKVTLAWTTWKRRDEILALKWNTLKKSSSTKKKHLVQPAVELASNEFGLVTYAPALPLFVLAQYLQREENKDIDMGGNCLLVASKADSLSVAARVLWSVDKLFSLSTFFGVPLIDRTGTWKGALRTHIVVPPTPTREQVQAYYKKQQNNSSNDNNNNNTAAQALEETMMRRAEAIWSLADSQGGLNVVVCWSGGMDSTGVLVCLLRSSSGGDRRSRLQVILDEESIREHPSFYEEHIIQGKLTVIPRQGHTLSELAKIYARTSLLVTGELGDQLFGSDKCSVAFEMSPQLLPPLTNPEREFLEKKTSVFSSLPVHLDEPWEETLLPLLLEKGALSGGATAWKSFMAPQIDKAPFPIVTLHDMLWWLNFSCKWQNVAVRCLHDGGDYHPTKGIGVVTHFYDDRELELWACVPEFHKVKFGNLRDWTTYKQPLKDVIQNFHRDDNYYKTKTKVGSLAFDLNNVQSEKVDRTLGLVVNSTGGMSELTSETMSSGEIHNRDLARFIKNDGSSTKGVEEMLEPWIINSYNSKPRMLTPSIVINPWTNAQDSNPFDEAPQFANTDERQRRKDNPVTAITLHGKCSALLPPVLVRGKTVLDLGACLGAMCHWSLFYGAKHVVGVEPQQNFCERMTALLKSARATWPSHGGDRFTVVCAEAKAFLQQCRDQSFDIIVAAGVLHCFQDSVQVLNEMARVGKTVCIESTHLPSQWFIRELTDTPLSNSIGLLEWAPSACVNIAGEDASFRGSAVVPSEQLVRNLMEVHGFDTVGVRLENHPTSNEDVMTYTGNREMNIQPIRYFLRCTTREASALPMLSLEDCIKTGLGYHQAWTTTRCGKDWTDYAEYDGGTAQETDISEEFEKSVCNKAQGTWQFDEAVAHRFGREARSHIPDYEEVISSCLDAVSNYFGQEELSRLKAVDAGCAIGYTMVQMLKKGIGHVYGFDTSQSMLDVALSKLREAVESSSVDFSKATHHLFLAEDTHIPSEISTTGDPDVVMMNWTLHFLVEAADRLNYMSQIFDVLKPGGMFLLTEKTKQDHTTKTMYYNWKAADPQNVSWKIIKAKENMLKGVLETLPLSWYLDALERVGFREISILRAKYGFVTLICCKPAERSLDPTLVVQPFVSWHRVEESAHSVVFDGAEDPQPYILNAWGEKSQKSAVEQHDPRASSFGFVLDGEVDLTQTLPNGRQMQFHLFEGMYFSCPGCFELKGGSGFITTVPDARDLKPLFSIGGPLEHSEDGHMVGRLPYIDGCTDTLLISPVIHGAACLNHLHFPSGVTQTQHTHPSGRAGAVVQGSGICRWVDLSTNLERSVQLERGMVFCIPRNLQHAFETADGQTLDVVAFHPDSDFGPTATCHPMVNRTIVNGVSASVLNSIQTKRADSQSF